jgi:hypothetical protein
MPKSMPRHVRKNVPKSSWRPFQQAYRVADTLWKKPKLKQRPNGRISHRVSSQQETRRPSRPIAPCVTTYFRYFLSSSLKHSVLLNLIKDWRHQKNFKTISGSWPICSLSNHTTFSQSQSCATVPLSCEATKCQIIK